MSTTQKILSIFPEFSNHGMNCGCNILIFGNQVPQMEYMAIKTYLNKMDRNSEKADSLFTMKICLTRRREDRHWFFLKEISFCL